jgi:formylmethanofuran dehydrogenase subunit C
MRLHGRVRVIRIAMPLVLVPRSAGRDHPLAIDLDGILPEVLAPLPADAAARLAIRADGRPALLGDHFTITGWCDDATLECRGDFSRVHRIGAGMRSGAIRVNGSVGRHAGARMAGGRLDVTGDAGDWLAAEMSGGEIHVRGRSGDNTAAALAGGAVGMRGGLVVVHGSAGAGTAARMRRGIVAIGGDCGAAAGFEMLAGTLVIGGAIGQQPGLAMRRGSVIAVATRPDVPATFRRGATWRPAFLPLLLRRLHAAGYAPAGTALGIGTWRQWHGDPLAGGRGEILHPA